MFFRRDKGRAPATGREADGAGELRRRADDERERLVPELAQVVVESLNDAPLERETLELLQVGLLHLIQRECSNEAVLAGQTAARLGYLTRAAESAMFDGHHEPDGDLAATLAERLDEAQEGTTQAADAMADLAADMASGEAIDPSPAEGGPTWTLPGLGGDDRRGLRDELVSRIRCPPDISGEDLKRTWKYGYFLCALDELCQA